MMLSVPTDYQRQTCDFILKIRLGFVDGDVSGCIILCKDFLKLFMCMSMFCLHVQARFIQLQRKVWHFLDMGYGYL